MDYLILGSGISALTFGALAAKQGKKVTVLEAHEFPGGFAHTFVEGKPSSPYHFNAQLHYVWDCGEGEPVYRILKKLGLHHQIPFIKYNESGFDHMRIPGYALNIPSNYDSLHERLAKLFPKHQQKTARFLKDMKQLAYLANRVKKPSGKSLTLHAIKSARLYPLLKFYGKTLQQVFDYYDLPLPTQSLLASQWHDFLLPPNQLAFYCWLILFDGYMRGAYYPEHHFESVINGLVDIIKKHQGQIIFNQKVVAIEASQNKVQVVKAVDKNQPESMTEYNAKEIICNFDPKQAVEMIGPANFSAKIRKQVNYDYSYSNFVVYGAVKDIDLRDYGFGNWNLFHSEDEDINRCFHNMYHLNDYSKPSFALTTPSLVTKDPIGCPEGEQIFQLLTVANYQHFKDLKLRNQKNYLQWKKIIYNHLLNCIEKHYVPDFRKHISFKMLGSPTTNESYCWAPEGNSYGSNMTPENVSLNRLGYKSSLKNFYFCNASSGFAGFTKSFQNGAYLYEQLTRDVVPAYA